MKKTVCMGRAKPFWAKEVLLPNLVFDLLETAPGDQQFCASTSHQIVAPPSSFLMDRLSHVEGKKAMAMK